MPYIYPGNYPFDFRRLLVQRDLEPEVVESLDKVEVSFKSGIILIIHFVHCSLLFGYACVCVCKSYDMTLGKGQAVLTINWDKFVITITR